MKLKDKFIEEQANKIFGNNYSQKQYLGFTLRFDPDNVEEHIVPHKEIADKISDSLQTEGENFNQSSINQIIREVINKIYNTFSQELEQDGISRQIIQPHTNTRKNRWQILYHWLWDNKYPRWLWDTLKQQAQKESDRQWIKFSDVGNSDENIRGIDIDTEEIKQWKEQRQHLIHTNRPLTIQLDLQTGKYLILINRSIDYENNETRYLVAPSPAFAPNFRFSKLNQIIPQPEAICSDIKFRTPGIEEFIGILVDDKFDFSFLNPNQDEAILQWSDEHLKEIGDRLDLIENWQVFYKKYTVV